MARMIPATLPEYTQSKAERQLFPILRNNLDNSFTVFHSFNLLTKNRQDKFIDGEIDYLIFSPRYGFLALEVKGGPIIYDGRKGIWYRKDIPMKLDPFKQATASKYKLQRFVWAKLKDLPQCTFAHAVCFPSVYTELKEMPPGADANICITAKDFPQIGLKITDIMKSFGDAKTRTLDIKDIARINRLLMPYCEFGCGLLDRIGRAEQALFRLTENQCHYLEFIMKHREALIEGCAGSGKTVLAIKKAKELAAEGKSVLLLAYNRMLGGHLTSSVKDLPNITACTYHKFCWDRLNEADKLPEQTREQDYWLKILPNALASLIKDSPIKYDAVIVDEGQDFQLEYWLTITDLLKEGGYFYIFYDPDQNIYGTKLELPISKEPFVLTDNCRNTRSIFEKLKPYVGREMRLSEDVPEGERVVEFRSPIDSVRRKQLSRILHDLINNHGVDRGQIVILGAHSISRTCIDDQPDIGNFHITEGIKDSPNIVHYHTFMKFKGCEADVVILLDVDPSDERWANQMNLYTTISRAKHMLYIIHKGEVSRAQ